MENSQNDSRGLSLQNRMLLGRIIGIVIVLGAVATGSLVWHINYQNPRTNDAMVRANIVGIAPEVSGRIVELHVEDNQYVKQGDLLYVIDPRPYQARLDKAKAELLLAEKDVDSRRASSGSAEIAIERLEHQRAAANAEVKKIEAEDEYLHNYLERLEPLADKQYVTTDQLKQARSRYAASRAELADAKAKEQSARSAIEEAKSDSRRAISLIAQVGDVNARIEVARAMVTAAELDLEYCYVRAPFNAYVTNLNTREGEYAKAGAQMFALVDDRHWYVIADFKETYLKSIKPGLEAEVFLVGYPGKRYRGVVTGIGWANSPDNIKQQGVLPEVERTLNWVILASRFPVRIEIAERDPEHPLRMGMTAFVTVRERSTEGAGKALPPS
ncbi:MULTISPECIES: biotin/lipoyl-binding protein [Methylomonas]|uniref:Secretion protein HlyD n=2 Tax=Methylomonas TaxID=416 RepID=A0A126T7M2_9GAMM|nr:MULTISPECIES: biotin/lipoyl-binding protein [Methylomonas]AMK78089.1 secretion protein HlyD [Methylomonas denitrificans]OAI07615.1 secretion protein HlyD [Methylomonas methanica]TCV85625.1 multidrug efflux system membrane fusion protein [Methylomonas methanica]